MEIKNPIDTYINTIENPSERTTLENLRKLLHELLPESEECLSYSMPALKVRGKAIAGFAKFKHHLSFFPFSGSILEDFREELDAFGFSYTKSGIHFTPEKPIPRELIEKILQKRLKSI